MYIVPATIASHMGQCEVESVVTLRICLTRVFSFFEMDFDQVL